MFGLPKRIKNYTNKFSLVDGIPFKLPVAAVNSPALMAIFPIDAEKAKDFLPAGIHPLRLWNSALLIVTVIDYRETPIGKYVEYSIAIGCTHGEKPAPRLLPAIFMNWFKTGQYVVDLPVSSEVSVKGGKGIWGRIIDDVDLWHWHTLCDCKVFDDAPQTRVIGFCDWHCPTHSDC